MSVSGTYRIRPAGRHIMTIGRDLIQDSFAAVVELVKNAYDADSSHVNIDFTVAPDRNGYHIVISDNGHGMSMDTVINKWMVPSTKDKLDRRRSPSGRVMQGRKGVGRFAASILGVDLLLETVNPEGEKTTLYIEWSNFEKAQYLDDVEILIETTNVNEDQGTKITIYGDSEKLAGWNETQFRNLRRELKKLKPPVTAEINDLTGNDDFQIRLTVEEFAEIEAINETIEPYPLLDLFDYKIFGEINSDGKGILTYSIQKARNTTEEKILFDAGWPTGCGELNVDIRVYDREMGAIDSLIRRGLKDDFGNYLRKTEARALLDENNGIGVFRNGFRIRPLGDADFDWLKLNEDRVQNPSLRISSNQVIGFVQIQSEEMSGLIEKSARDGLYENKAFEQLKKISKCVIGELETRRLDYRKKAGLSRPVIKIERELERLFSSDEMKQDIRAKLTNNKIDEKTADEIISIISRNEEDKNKIVDEIRQAVAIYQGQATLGKIINVVLHEGRRPLNYFKNQIPNLRYWYKSFLKNKDIEKIERLMPIANGIGDNAELFVKLFSRLDPLAAGKRSARKPLDLKKIILDALSVFETEVKENNVSTQISGPEEFMFKSWPQDIYAIFTNLFDNSLYWMREKKIAGQEINIELVTDGDSLLYIDYHDTGPGIEPNFIASEVIFEPHFSTKPSGMGLGLAIAGEAALRNGLELKAFESDLGAYFRLQHKNGE